MSSEYVFDPRDDVYGETHECADRDCKFAGTLTQCVECLDSFCDKCIIKREAKTAIGLRNDSVCFACMLADVDLGIEDLTGALMEVGA